MAEAAIAAPGRACRSARSGAPGSAGGASPHWLPARRRCSAICCSPITTPARRRAPGWLLERAPDAPRPAQHDLAARVERRRMVGREGRRARPSRTGARRLRRRLRHGRDLRGRADLRMDGQALRLGTRATPRSISSRPDSTWRMSSGWRYWPRCSAGRARLFQPPAADRGVGGRALLALRRRRVAVRVHHLLPHALSGVRHM